MGIKHLLQFLKPFTNTIHIEKYRGKRVGIDAYAWLHKGAYGCSREICMNYIKDVNGNKLPIFSYFMRRINLLRHYEIIPVVVFDGGNLPCKAATEEQRERRKAVNQALAMQKWEQGEHEAAIELFQHAVCITPAIAHECMKDLRAVDVEYIVGPYEADPQLAYLSNLEDGNGGVSAVLSEDSDLLAYGCKAVIFKMDQYGNGEEILMDEVLNNVSGNVSFKGFDWELFTGMCVLAGCDYLPSIPGIGIKRAHALVSKYKDLNRVLSNLKFDKNRQMPDGYIDKFREAITVFQHAMVYDSSTKKLVHMKPLPEDRLKSLNGNLDILGPKLDPSIAISIAEGHLDPITFKALGGRKAQVATKKKENFFKAISSRNPRRAKIAAAAAQEVISISEILEDKTLLREAAALERLINASPISDKNILLDNTVKEVMVFPDNNPFANKKKRKFKENAELPISCLKEIIDISETVPGSKLHQER